MSMSWRSARGCHREGQAEGALCSDLSEQRLFQKLTVEVATAVGSLAPGLGNRQSTRDSSRATRGHPVCQSGHHPGPQPSSPARTTGRVTEEPRAPVLTHSLAVSDGELRP